MRKSSIYVDTSVIGGCCDQEFQEWSNGLLADIKAGKFSLFLSELSDAEVEDAPEEVRKIYLEFRNCAERVFQLSAEAIELADAYLNHRILTPNYRNDARHIALQRLLVRMYWLAGISSMSFVSKRFRNSMPLISKWGINQFRFIHQGR